MLTNRGSKYHSTKLSESCSRQSLKQGSLLQLMQLVPEARAGEASLWAARLLVCGRSTKGLSLVGLRHSLPLQQVSRSQGPRSWTGNQTNKQAKNVFECTCICAPKHRCASMYVHMNVYTCVCTYTLCYKKPCGKIDGRMPWLCLPQHVVRAISLHPWPGMVTVPSMRTLLFCFCFRQYYCII